VVYNVHGEEWRRDGLWQWGGSSRWSWSFSGGGMPQRKWVEQNSQMGECPERPVRAAGVTAMFGPRPTTSSLHHSSTVRTYTAPMLSRATIYLAWWQVVTSRPAPHGGGYSIPWPGCSGESVHRSGWVPVPVPRWRRPNRNVRLQNQG